MYTRTELRSRRFALLIAVVAGVLGWEAWRMLSPAEAVRQGSLIIDIPAQESAVGIAARLRDAGVIRSPMGFVALSVVRGSARTLKAGEYEIPRGASTPDVLSLLESGRVRLHPVLHPEGATVAELARALESTHIAQAADVMRAAADVTFLRANAIEGANAEGYLFPDTYHFVRGLPAEQILGRMVQRMQSKLTPEIRARARARNVSVHELLTMASIIEREAMVREERRLISAVFWNRLRLGMPLQADPTVQYAMGKDRRSLTRADLLTDHPYNTYQRSGLPPGPIASPGIDAIMAALDPAPVKYLYFVKKDDQHHHFSTTVEEHNNAVARYRLVRSR